MPQDINIFALRYNISITVFEIHHFSLFELIFLLVHFHFNTVCAVAFLHAIMYCCVKLFSSLGTTILCFRMQDIWRYLIQLDQSKFCHYNHIHIWNSKKCGPLSFAISDYSSRNDNFCSKEILIHCRSESPFPPRLFVATKPFKSSRIIRKRLPFSRFPLTNATERLNIL